jgi:hypothetical protein
MLLSISGMICRFTLNANYNPLASKILITTYKMITHQNSCSSMEFRRIMWLQQQEWGIMVDEVHAISTDMLDSVLTIVQAPCNLGLITLSSEKLVFYFLYML